MRLNITIYCVWTWLTFFHLGQMPYLTMLTKVKTKKMCISAPLICSKLFILLPFLILKYACRHTYFCIQHNFSLQKPWDPKLNWKDLFLTPFNGRNFHFAAKCWNAFCLKWMPKLEHRFIWPMHFWMVKSCLLHTGTALRDSTEEDLDRERLHTAKVFVGHVVVHTVQYSLWCVWCILLGSR